MGYHLPRYSRSQSDRELYGGSLKQKSFKGGMNMDAPASELKEDELALAENVICREYGLEARPGSIQYNQALFSLNPTLVNGYCYTPSTFAGSYQGFRHVFNYNNTIRSYPDSPNNSYIESVNLLSVSGSGTYAPGTGNTTIVPYRRGALLFTTSKISYNEPGGAFQVNAPNPIHGVANNAAATRNYAYRYLFTLSRIIAYSQDPSSGTSVTDRLSAGAELVHETGTNGKRYNASGTSTARNSDAGEINKAAAISAASPLVIPTTDLVAAFGSASDVADNTAASHFTHVSIYRTLDVGPLGIGPQGAGNNEQLYVWVGDVSRASANGSGTFSDGLSDDDLRNRIQSGNFLLKSRGLQPIPSGDCAEVTSGFIFVADRSNATTETRVHYCSTQSPELFGYYFPDLQQYRFNDGIRAMKANQDILSIFCNNSSHICALTSITEDTSKLQYIPVLNYFQPVDRTIGVRDWGTISSVDQNTMIAVCSDGTVRLWDGTKWGDDLSYGKVNSEIRQIVPASPASASRGSIGRYYKGAYELWYSKSSSDTYLTSHLRYGFGKDAGYGWTKNTNYVKPPFKVGAEVIIDDTGVQRMIVMSGVTSSTYTAGHLYWVNTFRPFTGAVEQSSAMDRVDIDGAVYYNSSAGSEITQKIRFREMSATEESRYLVHQESHLYLRPLVEETGYRSGASVSFLAYEDGSTTASETMTNVPKTADIRFTKEIAARRIQLEVQLITGASRLVGIDSHCRSLDRINYATAGDNSSSESTTSYPQHQYNLASNMRHWVTRRNFAMDRVSATNLTQAGTVSWGPGADGGDATAYNFVSSGTLSKADTFSYSGDFALSFWVKSYTDAENMVSITGTNTMYVRRSGSGSIYVNDGLVTTAGINDGAYHHICAVRSGTTVTVYYDGASVYTATDSLAFGGSTFIIGSAAATGYIDDVRVYSAALTAATVAYLYSDTVNNSGNNTRPMV